MDNSKHAVLIITGLGDEVNALRLATSHWRNYGLHPIVHALGWRDPDKNFSDKLMTLVDQTKRLKNQNHPVSLVGISAGGSAAINVASKLEFKINKVITVCARLHTGPLSGLRSFSAKTASSPIFAASVKSCETVIKSLKDSDKSKILNVYSRFGDELVPSQTSIIDGCEHTSIPALGHLPSIFLALTLRSDSLISFLKS